MIQSLGVVIAAVTLYYNPTLIIIDPLISIFFSIIAFSFTLPITINILQFLVDMSPKHFDLNNIEKELSKIKYVEKLHKLHLWALNGHDAVLTVHLVLKEEGKEEFVRNKVKDICEEIGVTEFTVQIELEGSELFVKCGAN